jgi:hypothetical protein
VTVTEQTTTPEAPAGLTVTVAELNPVGIAYRAHCDAHDYCRNPSSTYAVTWCADGWEDLHLRVYPAFYRHCQDMEQWA